MISRQTRLVTPERAQSKVKTILGPHSTSVSDTLQDCLTRNGYDETKCTKFVDALYECCKAFYEKNGDDATTVSCPKAHLLRLKMEQRKGKR